MIAAIADMIGAVVLLLIAFPLLMIVALAVGGVIAAALYLAGWRIGGCRRW